MICNVQMLSSCSSLAHCTPFSALLSAPSFAWQCLTPWLLIYLAPGPALYLCVFSICDHKGVSSIDSSTVSTVIDSIRQYRQCGNVGSLEHSIDSIDSIDSSTVRQYRQSIDSIDSGSTVSTVSTARALVYPTCWPIWQQLRHTRNAVLEQCGPLPASRRK